MYTHIQTYFTTVNAFLRLEKIVFGDIRGGALTHLVEAMYAEFNELLNAFQGKGGDPLDLSTTVSDWGFSKIDVLIINCSIKRPAYM